MGDRIEWVDDPKRFMALATPWNELADSDPTPFARHGWFASWWLALGPAGG